ncbi:MAG: DNA-protecting protein DprA [Sphingobacteriales bacterium]|nr:DNA-protecting protein DprA [Sphingobacteriales bacterium]
MTNDLLYQLALTLVPNIGPVQAKILLQHCEAEEIFHAKKSYLEKIEGIGPIRADSIVSFKEFDKAEEEIKFIEKYRIKPLFLTDEQYPKQLLNCYDSPTLLYYKGEADLNASKIVAIIGTRTHTDYAKQVTEKLVKELAEQNVTIISGLAFGVDAIAHKAALKNDLPTVAVLAHGLDQIYPLEHAGLAKDMVKHSGGLLTEFRSKTKPDKHNFPTRNRIVAGMSDATIVIETGIKGGSMITAELANGYNKDVFALPGKVTDNKSAGCNYLIKNNKAMLLTDGKEILEVMGWEAKSRKSGVRSQKELFIELSKEEKIVVEILKEKDSVHIDEINLKSGLSSSAVAAAILNLELQNVMVSLPGKLYRLA